MCAPCADWTLPRAAFLLAQIRPDRQTLLWSATWPKEIQGMANEFLKNPYQVPHLPCPCLFWSGLCSRAALVPEPHTL